MGKSNTSNSKKSLGSANSNSQNPARPSLSFEALFVKYRITLMKIALVCVGIILSWVVYNLNNEYVVQIKLKSELKIQEESHPSTIADNSTPSQPTVVYEREPRPKYWFYMARGFMWIFFSVDNVLQKLGLEKTEITVRHDELISMEWDLLWSYDYFHEIPIDYSKLKYHQKINHIPGNYAMCMKDQLAINTQSKYIPPGFNNSKSLKEYAEKNPNKKYVQKLWSNRGVELKSVDEIEFSVFGPGFKYFAQVYVENPLLIEGHKFDFGIYVLISSIDPLRVYYYNKNTLIRLCEKKYNPNDYSDVDSYVISDACLFPWDIDALSVYYNQTYTYKEALNAYLTKKGYDVDRIWTQVDDCIREIVLSKEEELVFWTSQYPFKYSFFELYRFDFILDEDLNLYLIEINQSPNVNPSVKLYRDRRMYENLLFDSFTLLGIGKYIKRANFEFGHSDEEHMNGHEESLTVRPEICVSRTCNETCGPPECELCWKCLDNNERHDLHLAYREIKHRGSMKKVFPPSNDDMNHLGERYLKNLSPANRKHTLWFMEMCKKDSAFC